MPRFKQPFSLYKRKIKSSAKPVYHFWYYDLENKRRSASTGETSELKARKYAQGFVERLDSKTLREVSEEWWTWDHSYVQHKVARNHRISRSYVDMERSVLNNQVLPHLGDYLIPDITKHVLDDWILKLAKAKKSSSTIKNCITAIRPILQEQLELGVITINPASTLSGIGSTKKKIEIPSHAQLKQILSTDNWDSDAMGRPIELWRTYWLATAFCAYGGLRQGEVLAIQQNDVINYFVPPVGWEVDDPEDFVSGVHIRHSWDRKYGLKDTKTGDSRFVPLPLELLDWAYNKHTEGPFIFGGEKPVHYRQLSNAWNQAQKRAKIGTHFRFHSLRHYLNSYLLVEKGMALSKVQAITGHSTEAMSQNYAHASDEVLAEIGNTTAELYRK